MPIFFSELIDRDIATATFSTLGLFGLLGGDVETNFDLLPGLPPVVMKGCHFGQVGGNHGHAGVLHTFT